MSNQDYKESGRVKSGEALTHFLFLVALIGPSIAYLSDTFGGSRYRRDTITVFDALDFLSLLVCFLQAWFFRNFHEKFSKYRYEQNQNASIGFSLVGVVASSRLAYSGYRLFNMTPEVEEYVVTGIALLVVFFCYTLVVAWQCKYLSDGSYITFWQFVVNVVLAFVAFAQIQRYSLEEMGLLPMYATGCSILCCCLALLYNFPGTSGGSLASRVLVREYYPIPPVYICGSIFVFSAGLTGYAYGFSTLPQVLHVLLILSCGLLTFAKWKERYG